MLGVLHFLWAMANSNTPKLIKDQAKTGDENEDLDINTKPVSPDILCNIDTFVGFADVFQLIARYMDFRDLLVWKMSSMSIVQENRLTIVATREIEARLRHIKDGGTFYSESKDISRTGVDLSDQLNAVEILKLRVFWFLGKKCPGYRHRPILVELDEVIPCLKYEEINEIGANNMCRACIKAIKKIRADIAKETRAREIIRMKQRRAENNRIMHENTMLRANNSNMRVNRDGVRVSRFASKNE